MSDADLRRWIFVEESGNSEEVASFTFRHADGEAEDLGASQVEFPFTDATTELLTAWSCSGVVDGALLHRLGTADVVTVPMSGRLAPGSSLTFGAHVRRQLTATVQPETLWVRDVTWKQEFSAHEPCGPTVETVVVLPPSYKRRVINAAGATFTSTRAVMWRAPLNGSKTPVGLAATAGALPAALRHFDDLLAEAYREAARAAVGRDVASGWGERRLSAALDLALGACSGSKGELERVRGATTPAALMEAIRALQAHRGAIEAGAGAGRLDLGIVDVVDGLVCTTERLHREARLQMPVPQHATVAMEGVAAFAASCQGAAARWSSAPSEDDLERELMGWFLARGIAAEQQPRLNNGRVDLLVGDAPLELKVDDFAGSLDRLVEKHGQQAAEYAVRKLRGVAVLVGLDTSRRTDRLHGPDLRHRFDVRIVEGVGARTVVVACVITAFPQLPSELAQRSPGRGGRRQAGARPRA